MKRGARQPRQPAVAFRVAAVEALRKWNRGRHHHAKCGAFARSTGEPCRQLALANGKCRWHGGATPKNKQWHRPQYADGVRPDGQTKIDRKLRDRERAARKREVRLAAMTAEKRAAHAAWHRAHRPGVNRAALREEFRQNREAAAAMAGGSDRPLSAEAQALADRSAWLHDRIRTLEAEAVVRAAIENEEGVFG